MALVYSSIAIPSQVNGQAPDATPSLFNEQYTKCLANDQGIDTRLALKEAEIIAARGGAASLSALLVEIQANVEGMDPEFQNILVAQVLAATSDAGLALREIEKTLLQRFQTGQVIMPNRGIISGCQISISNTAARNVNVASGRIFQGGRVVPVNEQLNGASVPPNTGSTAAICWIFLVDTGSGVFDLQSSLLGDDVPSGAVVLSKITVPTGNNESNDQYLASCTISDQRRLESGYPALLATNPTAFIELPYPMTDTDYTVDLEIADFEGSGFQLGHVYVGSRAANGFTIFYNGTADSVDIRWTARKLDL